MRTKSSVMDGGGGRSGKIKPLKFLPSVCAVFRVEFLRNLEKRLPFFLFFVFATTSTTKKHSSVGFGNTLNTLPPEKKNYKRTFQ